MKIKLIGNFVRKSRNEDGDLEITFSLPNVMYEKYAQSLEKQPYSVVLSDVKEIRTNEQNKLLWALIRDIAKHENSFSHDDWDVYCGMLRLSKAKYTYVTVLKEGKEALAQAHGVRAVEWLGTEERENGKIFYKARIFLGSSQMSTKEMSVLIDKTIEYAEQLGIDTEYYKEGLLSNSQ